MPFGYKIADVVCGRYVAAGVDAGGYGFPEVCGW